MLHKEDVLKGQAPIPFTDWGKGDKITFDEKLNGFHDY